MFTKFTIYKIDAGLPDHADALAEYFVRSEFTPTTPNQAKAFGWAPPRAKHGAFVEAIDGQWIARVVIETRKVPADALQRRIDEAVARIEEATGRTPGRKQRAEIKEQCVAELMPQAFPKQVVVPVWIDRAAGLLVIGSTSASQCDDVIALLVRSVPEFLVSMIVTALHPAAAMAAWLSSFRYGELQSEFFEVGRECELRADDETKAVIRYKNEHLEREEVLDHLNLGKRPTRLALCFEQRVAFVLTDSLQFKSVELLEVPTGENEADAFDADVALVTGELSRMIASLFGELGGFMEVTPEAVKAEAVTGRSKAETQAGEDVDPLIDRARALVVSSGKASIAYIQRHLVIGYNRSARLLEALEIEGVVSPMGRDGHRTILQHEKAAT